MLMFMRGLEVVATIIVSTATIPFAAAWDAKSAGADKYRKTVKHLYYIPVAILAVLAGFICATLARLVAPLDPKPGTHDGHHPRSYLYRRNYRGRHFSGTPLILLTAKETNVAVAS